MIKIHIIPPYSAANLLILLLSFLVIISGCRDSASNYLLTLDSSSDSSSGDGSDPGAGDGSNPGTGDGSNPGTGDGSNPGSGDGSKKTSPCDTEGSGQISDPLIYHTYQIDSTNDNTLIRLVKIPAGYFWMGSKEGEGRSDERPRHCVHITHDFYLGETEVTTDQWKAIASDRNFLANSDSGYPVAGLNWNWIAGTGYDIAGTGYDNRQPVHKKSFIEQLNERAGTGTGTFRLPTEAEWEYAARAGTNTKYFFGDDEENLETYAWYYTGKHKIPSSVDLVPQNDEMVRKVKTKEKSPWGLYDIYGNAGEYVQDFYRADYYQRITADVLVDPTGTSDPPLISLDGSKTHVHRGGLPTHSAEKIYSAHRGYAGETVFLQLLGFRLAWDPPSR